MDADHTRTATSRTSRTVGSIVLAASTAIAVAWVVAFDLLVAASWLSPIGWVLALAPVTILALLSLMPLDRTKPSTRGMSWGAFLLGVLVVLVPWNPRKRFVHDVFSVRAGMSFDEVEAVMAGYIRGAGAQWQFPQSPAPRVREPGDPEDAAGAERARAVVDAYREPEDLDDEERRHFTGNMIYRWSTSAEYNADWGQVAFRNGRVVKVEFLPD